MNNNIQEPYCSFEVSKLLKEKGLISNESKLFFGEDGFSRNKKDYNMNTSVFAESYIERPTHALAIEWIRVNFGFYVEVDTPDGKDGKYEASVHKVKGYGSYYEYEADTPQEATETTLLYILKHLI